MSQNLHPVRHVSVGELSADIDGDLAPIIEVIWRLGLQTWTCCQTRARATQAGATRCPTWCPSSPRNSAGPTSTSPYKTDSPFLTALAQAGPRDAFYLRMARWAAPDSWDVSARPMDVATFNESLPSSFRQNLLLVRFPSYDRAEILRRLLEFEAGRVVRPGPVDRSSIGR